MAMIWDFVLCMSDGTQIHLHPDFKTRKVPAFIGFAAKDLSHPSTG